MKKTSLEKSKINIVLLEGVHQNAVNAFKDSGYTNIHYYDKSLVQDELVKAITDAHFVGIRSRTQITPELLAHARHLNAIGCFCIGTNQVNLSAAEKFGIPVFNAPFANTRSVAELVLAEAILLMRGIPEKNALAHEGGWQKSAKDSYEVRGKTLGIVGYGHIGTQLSILAENLGMHVIYYDIENKLALGNAQQVSSLDKLLKQSDVVSLHVPETPLTKNMLGKKQLTQMKAGSILINASRGTVVDIDALCEALASEHLHGAAIDVFPVEPKSNKDTFESPLRAFKNVILTPHIGGSTQEAQENIGVEVAEKLIKYSDNGSTLSAVNFPNVALPGHVDTHRILHIHRNEPGVLTNMNNIFSKHNINIAAQYLKTSEHIGYAVTDIATTSSKTVLDELNKVPATIRARVLY